jgi:hypothetical protein
MSERIREPYYSLMYKASMGWNDHLFQVPSELLETFADLIVTDCMIEIERLGIRNGYTEHNRALGAAWQAISDKFGVKST